MKYYIATKLENHKAHNELRDWLNSQGHQITFDWTINGPVWTKGLLVINTIAHLETLGVLDCDVLIMLWPGGRGTHVELGIALGTNKRIFILASSETCAFYHHSKVVLVKTHSELLDIFRRLYAGG